MQKNNEIKDQMWTILNEMEDFILTGKYSSADIKKVRFNWMRLMVCFKHEIKPSSYKYEFELYEKYEKFLTESKKISIIAEQNIYQNCINASAIAFSGVEVARFFLEHKICGIVISAVFSLIILIIATKYMKKDKNY